MMNKVRMYSTRMCPFCVLAKRLLANKGVSFDEIRVDEDTARRDEMMRITGRRTVPQIFVGEKHVGGFEDLSALERAGQLDPLLKE